MQQKISQNVEDYLPSWAVKINKLVEEVLKEQKIEASLPKTRTSLQKTY